MKKTLQEEKNRILEISRSFNKIQTINESLLLPHYLGELKIAVEKYIEEDRDFTGSSSPEELKSKLIKIVESLFDGAIGKQNPNIGKSNDHFEDLASIIRPGKLDMKKVLDTHGFKRETDEYHDQYNNNMTQGFKLNEDNEFVGAAKKAITEGKDTFKLKGKKYRVTLSKSKK